MSQKIQDKIHRIFNLIDFNKDSLLENYELLDYINTFNKIQIPENEFNNFENILQNFGTSQKGFVDAVGFES